MLLNFRIELEQFYNFFIYQKVPGGTKVRQHTQATCYFVVPIPKIVGKQQLELVNKFSLVFESV